VNSRIPPPPGPSGARYGTELDHALAAFDEAAMRATRLDPITTELVRLRCARYHDCRLCQSVRYDAAIEAGFTETLGDKVDHWEASDLEPRHKAALALVDAMLVAPRAADPAVYADAQRHFSAEELTELCLDVVKWSFQKVLVALRIEPPAGDELMLLSFDADGRARRSASGRP